LKRQGVDLLAGRAIMKSFHPFLACELDQRFELDEALNRGLVPVVYSSTNPDQALKTYTSLYLKEEVQLEGLVRNIGDFARFLESISFSHGSVLNISEVARDCHVKRETVQGYLSVLQDLLIAYTIPVFARRAKRIMVNHPKFYYFDSGVFRSLRPAGPLDQPGAIEAAALEGLVAQHLRAWIDYSDYSCILYYWRTKGGSEIDFIVYGEEVFWAVEVKNSNRIRNADLRSLKSFKTDYPEAKLFFVYRGEERLMIDGILCIPCTDFLLSLIPGKELTTKNTKNTKRGL
jgi:predicted AAA+ superfamily ATPase